MDASSLAGVLAVAAAVALGYQLSPAVTYAVLRLACPPAACPVCRTPVRPGRVWCGPACRNLDDPHDDDEGDDRG